VSSLVKRERAMGSLEITFFQTLNNFSESTDHKRLLKKNGKAKGLKQHFQKQTQEFRVILKNKAMR
jgi:hypothetical protein